MDHFQLVCDIGELWSVFEGNTGVKEFLNKTVHLISRHMHADVCSIYLYNAESKVINLKATKGLNSTLIDTVELKLGEGLTGLALKELRPICERNASKHANFRLFTGLFEEPFDSFLAVPILRGVNRIGVLVVQRAQDKPFEKIDVSAMQAVANQLAHSLEYARVLMGLPEKEFVETRMETQSHFRVNAHVSSPGFAAGRVYTKATSFRLKTIKEHASGNHYTLNDLKNAIKTTEEQLASFQSHLQETFSDVASLIFAAHMLFLRDSHFIGKIEELIATGINPVDATLIVLKKLTKMLGSVDHQGTREKVHDLTDVATRILLNMVRPEGLDAGYAHRIIITDEILPSEIPVMAVEKAQGLVIVSGGVTAHISILARSLHMPVFIANDKRLLHVRDGAECILDGETGNVYIDPTDEIRELFLQHQVAKQQSAIVSTKESKAHTFSDGTKVSILANINLLADADAALNLGAEGVGLYRTEFPFIIRDTFPSEDVQYDIYLRLIQNMKGKPVTFRTLDIGGDKLLPYVDGFKEENPFLGMRSMRFTLNNLAIFQQQIRAMIRAGQEGDIGIMFPMIGSVDEFIDARKVVGSCLDDLEQEFEKPLKKPRLGVMVELPSAVEMIRPLARIADFISIGTNDLVQYILAVDRTNEKVSSWYCSYHPAVLRSIARVADVAISENVPLSICGDTAHDYQLVPFLLGVGIRTLSVEPMYIPEVAHYVSQLTPEEAKGYAKSLLAAETLAQVREKLLPLDLS